MIEIDGSFGEGGGQVLRTALTLSACTGQPFTVFSIRAGRSKPGLLRQHLTAVTAAAAICGAKTTGVAIGSRAITFEPDGAGVRAGDYDFAIGSAGSASLVLQTILPALATAKSASTVQVSGGTHNPAAPPFEFLAHSFAPLARACGLRCEYTLEAVGFAPAGGGRIRARVEPRAALPRAAPFALLERGPSLARRAIASIAHLDRSIAERELRVVGEKLSLAPADLQVEHIRGSQGPGNALRVELHFANVTEILTEFGRIGLAAERVAQIVTRSARRYLESSAPVGEHLADQLLLPIALAGRGTFRTLPLTMHTRTNCEVIQRFLPVAFELAALGPSLVELSCTPAS